MDTSFCIESLEDSFSFGKPEIFNTDQGSQYTSLAFISVLKSNKIQISMNGRCRCLDGKVVEVSKERERLFTRISRWR